MSITLSSIDLHYLVRELKDFQDGLVDKIYMDEPYVFIRFYLRGQGKRFLNIGPNFPWESEKKPGPSRPHGFNDYLRKYISRAKITSISKVPGQRIIKITFEKETKIHMYLEFFGAGNVVLTDAHDKITSCLNRQRLQNRTITPGEQYPVDARDDLFTLEHDTLVRELIASDAPASKILASYAGRKWAVEVCLRAGIKEDKAIASKSEAEKLAHIVLELKDAPMSPVTYHQDDILKDVAPFKLVSSTRNTVKVPRMLVAYGEAYEPKVEVDVHDRKVSTITNRIAMQKERKVKLLKKAEDATAKAELIYSHYQEIYEILEAIKTARETLSWKEIKTRLKDHPIVKRIDEKNGKIHIEL